MAFRSMIINRDNGQHHAEAIVVDSIKGHGGADVAMLQMMKNCYCMHHFISKNLCFRDTVCLN